MVDLQYKFDSLQDAIKYRTIIVRTLLGKFDPEDKETIYISDKDMAITAVTDWKSDEFQFQIILDKTNHPKRLRDILVTSKNAEVKQGRLNK